MNRRTVRTYASGALISRLVAHVRMAGLDPAEIALAIGMDARPVADATALLPLDDALRYYATASEQLDDPCLGLRVATNGTLTDYGVTGFVMANHRTLRAGILDVASISNRLMPDFVWTHEVRQDGIAFRFDPKHPSPGASLIVQEILASIVHRSRDLVPTSWPPLSVSLAQAPPAGTTDALQTGFGVAVRFRAPHNEVVLSHASLGAPVPGADENLLLHLHEAVDNQVARRRAAQGGSGELLRVHGTLIDLARGEVHRNGEQFHLTTKEREILAYLAERANKVVPHDALEREVWGLGKHVVSHAPAVAIRRLRQKIEHDPKRPKLLVTVFGEGWKLVIPSQGEV